MPYNRPYRNNNRDRSRRRRERLNAALRRLEQEDDEEDFVDIPLAQTMPAIMEDPERERMEDVERPTGIEVQTQTEPGNEFSNRSTFARNFADAIGGETKITPVPGPYPRWLPETATFTHILNWRVSRYKQTDGSALWPDSDCFDLLIKPNDPEAFFTSMNGTPGQGTYDIDKASMYQYCKTVYEYFTVLACRVTVTFTDWCVIDADPLGTTMPEPTTGENSLWPDFVVFESVYSSDAPLTYDQTALTDSGYMVLLGLRNVKIHQGYDRFTKVSTDHPQYRQQACTIKKQYTKADYNKIMDITTDAENTIWTASGGSPTLPFVVRYMPRWKYPRSDAVTKNAWMTADFHLEWDIQWKQLSTELSGGYWNVPDLHV